MHQLTWLNINFWKGLTTCIMSSFVDWNTAKYLLFWTKKDVYLRLLINKLKSVCLSTIANKQRNFDRHEYSESFDFCLKLGHIVWGKCAKLLSPTEIPSRCTVDRTISNYCLYMATWWLYCAMCLPTGSWASINHSTGNIGGAGEESHITIYVILYEQLSKGNVTVWFSSLVVNPVRAVSIS